MWIARATRSLPVPVSPSISTVIVLLAMIPMSLYISRIWLLFPTNRWPISAVGDWSAVSTGKVLRTDCVRKALSRTLLTISRSIGFGTKSNACKRIASIVVSTSSYAVMIITITHGCCALISANASSPLIPGNFTSRRTISGLSAAMRRKPSSALFATLGQ